MIEKKTVRGRRISSEVRQLIISQAIHDSKTMPRRALAVRLQDLIQKMGDVSPTEDTLARMISEARNKQPSELERPWCIGVCAYYGISPDAIPILLRLQNLITEPGSPGKLTIREARWVARLYPATGLVANKPNELADDDERLLRLSFIVPGYVLRERVSEQMNEPFPNTSDLDRLYFAGENFLSNHVLEKWWDILPEEYRQAVVKAIERERPVLHEELRRSKGRDLTDEENKMIDECLDIMKSDGPSALRDYVKDSPLALEFDMVRLVPPILYSITLFGGS